MRGLTRGALGRLRLTSQSWEYASEMILKATRLGLRTAEVPVHFYRDREGRVSHHKRAGWLSPWRAGWINLKVMFLYAADLFLIKPGALMLALGLLLAVSLVGGPYSLGGVGLNLHFMLLGATLTTLGYGAVQLGVLARSYYNFDPEWRHRWARAWTYDRGLLAAGAVTALGLALGGTVLCRWVRDDFLLYEVSHAGVFGLLLLMLGFQTFTFTLLLQMINLRDERQAP
jgi:hypothetical protein